jgi:flavodoxin
MVSQLVEQTLSEQGMQVTRKEVSQTNPDEFGNFDLVVLGSPSWDFEDKEGWPHEDYLPFMEQAKQKSFEGKKFAVFGLGDSSYTQFCGAVAHLEELVKAMKGALITESLKIDGFYFKQEENSEAAKTWAAGVAKAASGQ